MALVVAMFAVGAILFVACKKENQEIEGGTPVNEKEGNSELMIETECTGIVNQYTLLDMEENLWRWVRFENNDFVMDIDVLLELKSVEMFKYIDEKTFSVLFEDGSEILIGNVRDNGNKVEFSSIADNDSILKCKITFMKEFNFMEVIKELDGKSIATIDSAKLPIGPILRFLYELVTTGVSVFEGHQDVKCEREMESWAEKCKKNDCLPRKGTCSVECMRKPETPSDVDCAQFHYFG